MGERPIPEIEPADPLVSLSRAGKYLAVDGKPRHPVSVWRDCTKGHPHPISGERIRLRHARIGRRIATRKSWCEQFIRELTASRDDAPAISLSIVPLTPSRSSSSREAAARSAGDELKRLGF